MNMQADTQIDTLERELARLEEARGRNAGDRVGVGPPAADRQRADHRGSAPDYRLVREVMVLLPSFDRVEVRWPPRRASG